MVIPIIENKTIYQHIQNLISQNLPSIDTEDLTPSPHFDLNTDSYSENAINRTMFSTTYENDTGFIQKISTEPINFHNGTDFEAINRTLVPSTTPEYSYMVDKGLYNVFFKQNSLDPYPIKFVYKDYELGLQPINLNYDGNAFAPASDVTGGPRNHIFPTHTLYNLTDTFMYPNIFGNRFNLTYTYMNDRFKMVLYIPDNLPQADVGLTQHLSLRFSLNIDSRLTARAENGDINFYPRGSKDSIFTMQKPVLYEKFAWSDVLNLPDQRSMECSYTLNGNIVSLNIPYGELMAKNFRFPLELDPTIYIDVAASSDDARGSGFIFDSTAATYTMRNFAGTLGYRFKNVNVDSDSGIQYFKLKLATWQTATVRCNFYGDDQDNAPTFSMWDAPDDRTKTAANTYYEGGGSDSPNGVYNTRYFTVTGAGNEILARPGWSSGNSMAFVITDSGTDRRSGLDIHNYDHASYPEPQLIIYYLSEQPQAPWVYNEVPLNNSVDNLRVPMLNITVHDNNTESMVNITWRSNSSGTWKDFAYNLSITDDNFTAQQRAWNFSVCGASYFWSVNVSDGTGNWTNHTYKLTLADNCNNPPYIIWENPLNNSVNISHVLLTQLSVWIGDLDNDTVNWTIETGKRIGNSSWRDATQDDTANETKYCPIVKPDKNTTYSWYVNVTDGDKWYNESYNFTTTCWLGLDSSFLIWDTGGFAGNGPAEALDGTTAWWALYGSPQIFILDLGGNFSSLYIRGQSQSVWNPTVVNAWLSFDNSSWNDRINPSEITDWQTIPWNVHETNYTTGRYLMVVVNDTDHVSNWLEWGATPPQNVPICDICMDFQRQLSRQLVNDTWFTGGNNTDFQIANETWFTGGNNTDFQQVNETWFTGGNITAFQLVNETWFTGGNETVGYNLVNDTWFTGGNNTDNQQVNNTWFSGGNETIFRLVNDTWFTGGNTSTGYFLINETWFTGGNETIQITIIRGISFATRFLVIFSIVICVAYYLVKKKKILDKLKLKNNKK